MIALAVAAAILVIVSFPSAWLLMLFLGNVGLTGVSFWGALPGGILLTLLIAGAGAGGYSTYSTYRS